MSKLTTWFNRFAHRQEDSENVTFTKMLILMVAMSCCVCGIVWGIIYYIVFGFGLIAILPIIFVVLVGGTAMISHQLRDHRPLIYAQLICITWISTFIQWCIGSMDQSGMVIAWSFLGPLGALIFLSSREAMFWMAMFLAIVFISATFEPALLGERLTVSDATRTLFYIMNLGASTIVVFAASAWFVSTIQRERNLSEKLVERIRTLFGQHVSREVANQLIAGNGNATESKSLVVTVMFLDIRDFTMLADLRSPKEIANLQNTVLGELINIIRDHRGTVLQLLGDGLYAVFGAPVSNSTHITDAVNASFAILEQTKKLCDEGQIPDIQVGIGLHTGRAIAGEIGNEYRKHYSITGTNVIIAARLEQLNKDLNSQFLISEAVYDAIKHNGYHVTNHGGVQLKGIGKPVVVYQLV